MAQKGAYILYPPKEISSNTVSYAVPVCLFALELMILIAILIWFGNFLYLLEVT